MFDRDVLVIVSAIETRELRGLLCYSELVVDVSEMPLRLRCGESDLDTSLRIGL